MKNKTMTLLALALVLLVDFPGTSFAQSKKQPISGVILRSYSPIQPHLVTTELNETRIVFSRIDGDVDGGPVAYYQAVFEDGREIYLENNYLTVTPDMLNVNQRVAFRAIFQDGYSSNFSEFLDLSYDEQEIEESSTNTFLDAELEPTFAFRSIPVLTPPLFGPFNILRRSVSDNATDGPWGYWQHESEYHRPGRGIDGANDTKAFDINLNLRRVASGARNLDVGMDFYAVADGTVVKWHGTISSSSSRAKPVLIEHVYNNSKYWSGYLHASEVYVRPNDYVTPRTRIGKIGMAGTDNDHLHLAVYTGSNARTAAGSLLVSVDAQFGESRLNIVPLGQQTVRRNERRLFTTTAYGIRPYSTSIMNLNHQGFSRNTWWTTSNSSVATVDSQGYVRGVNPGQATITVYFSGGKASTVVKVIS